MKQKLIKRKNKITRGFTLVELLVAMFISSLIIVTVVAAFASAFSAQKKARDAQKSVEDAKASLELMAKIIRMSSNVQLDPPASNPSAGIYMYNKSIPACIEFKFVSSQINEYSCTPPAGAANPCSVDISTDCGSLPTAIPITNAKLDSASFFIPSTSSTIKRVTIRIRMSQSMDANAIMQTTVSQRNYKDLNPTSQ